MRAHRRLARQLALARLGTGGPPAPAPPGPASPGVAAAIGAGAAYQAVAQATAQAIQDGTSYLRAIEMIAATTVGVASAQIAANPSSVSTWTPVITAAMGTVPTATEAFGFIGSTAASVLSGFPST